MMADCPFCGSNKTTVKTDGDGRGWDECRICGATSGSRSKYDGEEGDEPSDNSFNALNLKLAAARLDGERTGYVKALDKFAEKWEREHGSYGGEILNAYVVLEEIEQLKSDYLKESENGKTE